MKKMQLTESELGSMIEKVPEKLTKKEHQIEFAIRAKKHWK
jgi:hypothetical protein